MNSAEAARRGKLWAASHTDDALRRMARGIRLPDELSFIQSLQIEDKVSGGLIDFSLWDFQKELIADLRSHDRLLVVKARQLGITWTVLAHLLYEGTFWSNRLFLVCSQTGGDAIDALHRLRILHASIPDKWRPVLLKDNTQQIAFANGSRFEALMATTRAGRGKAPYITVCDEVAFWDDAGEKLATLEPGAQQMIIVSTGNGPDGPLPTYWRKSQAGEGDYHGIFYPWSVHPGRDQAVV